MRQVITLGAHIMNQNDQFIIFGSIINKQNRFSENRTFPTCYRQNRRAQQKHLSGIKKERNPLFIIFFYSTKIGTVFFNQHCRVLETGCRQKAPDSQTYEQKTLRREREDRRRDRKTDSESNRHIEIETLQSLLIQRAGALMAKCEIQVTIHTGTIVCDALCWRLMSHSGYVGPLFCSHGKGI